MKRFIYNLFGLLIGRPWQKQEKADPCHDPIFDLGKDEWDYVPKKKRYQ